MATASEIRQVAIEVQRNIALVKTGADTIKTDVDAIHTVTNAWVLNGLDADLPTEAAVKAQMVAYEALSVSLSKPSNSISDAIEAIRAAV